MGNILYTTDEEVHVLKFVGEVRVVLGPTLSKFLKSIASSSLHNSIVIDLSEATNIDSTALGLLAKISFCSQETYGKFPTIFSTNPDINRMLDSMGFDAIFIIVEEAIDLKGELTELPTQLVSEPEMREQVLSAHKTLMNLNSKNNACFCDLVEALEKEQRCENASGETPSFQNRKAC